MWGYSMGMQRRNYGLARKKVILILFVLVLAAPAALYALFSLWDSADFALRSGVADAEEQAKEKQLWQCVLDLTRGCVDYHKACGSSELIPPDKDKQIPPKVDTAELKRNTVAYAKQLQNNKEKLLKMEDNEDIGYRLDALLLHAVLVRYFNLRQMGLEVRLNAEAKYKRLFNNEMYDDYYRFVCLENKDGGFIYPDRAFKELEHDLVFHAQLWFTHLCGREHGGYELYQGRSYKEVGEELSSFADSSIIADLLEGGQVMLSNSRMNCLERRFEHGSSFASIWYPGRTASIEKAVMPRLKEYERNNRDFFDLPHSLCTIRVVRTQEDRLWYLMHYLVLSTDNYLWTIKYSNKQNSALGRTQKIRIRPRYAKDSQDMKYYQECFKGDISSTIACVEAGNFNDVSEMKAAALRLCKAAEGILDSWERYRKGQTDYLAFCADLRGSEAQFAKARLELLEKRWDYLYKYSQGTNGYVISSLLFDGVPKEDVAKLLQMQQKTDEAPAARK